MTKAEKQRIEEALRLAQLQEQQNKNLIRIIQRTDVKDLEEERFKNLSPEEKNLFK